VQPAGVSAVKRVKFPWRVAALNVRASSDARLALAIDASANVVRVWPAEDITKADAVNPGAPKLLDARWRPGAPRDVAWLLDQNVGVFTYQTSSVGTIYRGQGIVRIMTWRADGSGLLLNEQGRGFFVVDMTSGRATAVSGLDYPIAGAVLLR
jgi:hypothetical protein